MRHAPDEHPFQAGVEVAIVNRGYSESVTLTVRKVAKVLKTGNFRLEGSDQQYAASCWNKNDPDPQWFAHSTGNSGYSYRTRLEPLTDKLKAEAASSDRKKKFREIAETLSRARLDDVTEAQIAILQELLTQTARP